MVYDMEKGKFPVQLENIESFVELGQVCSACPHPLPSCFMPPPLCPVVPTAGATTSPLDFSLTYSFLPGVGHSGHQ